MKGFTLVELLIAFAIVGILISLLFISLDPLEQQKKVTDVTRVHAAESFYQAIIRSYMVRAQFPWKNDTLITSLNSPEGKLIIRTLVEYGELKSNFEHTTAKNKSFLFLISSNEHKTLSVCSRTFSKNYIQDAFYCHDATCYTCIGENSPFTKEALGAL